MSSSESTSFKAAMFDIVVAFAAIPLIVMTRGYVLGCAWLWFITPWIGLPVPPMAILIGLMLIVTSFAPIRKLNQNEKNIWVSISEMFLSQAVLLASAWIIHLFV